MSGRYEHGIEEGGCPVIGNEQRFAAIMKNGISWMRPLEGIRRGTRGACGLLRPAPPILEACSCGDGRPRYTVFPAAFVIGPVAV